VRRRPEHVKGQAIIGGPATRKRDVTILRSFFRYLNERGLIGVNPALLLTAPFSAPTVHNRVPRALAPGRTDGGAEPSVTATKSEVLDTHLIAEAARGRRTRGPARSLDAGGCVLSGLDASARIVVRAVDARVDRALVPLARTHRR
jgi:hypothetical protein